MRVLIVYAHPEPTSFNASMVSAAVEALEGAGHEVRLSDLYGMGFDPVSDRRNFATVRNAGRFDQQAEERFAVAHHGFAHDVAEEMRKVAWCDLLIFQFPLWWMGMPAIMKGWLDRVLTIDFSYGGGRWFDRGWFSGKRAMLSLTVGGPGEAYGPDGLYGEIEAVLYPIHHGVLKFVGLSVTEPFVVYGPGRMTEEARKAVLSDYRTRLAQIEAVPMLPAIRSDEYSGFVKLNH